MAGKKSRPDKEDWTNRRSTLVQSGIAVVGIFVLGVFWLNDIENGLVVLKETTASIDRRLTTLETIVGVMQTDVAIIKDRVERPGEGGDGGNSSSGSGGAPLTRAIVFVDADDPPFSVFDAAGDEVEVVPWSGVDVKAITEALSTAGYTVAFAPLSAYDPADIDSQSVWIAAGDDESLPAEFVNWIPVSYSNYYEPFLADAVGANRIIYVQPAFAEFATVLREAFDSLESGFWAEIASDIENPPEP